MGITCPACGLRNEPGARVCRNCGLPIAAAGDPLRGVTHGRVEMPGARGSGVSATVGLVMVVAVLLVAGTLAVSGGGLLDRGGRIGAAPPDASPAGSPRSEPEPVETSAPDVVPPDASPAPQGSVAPAPAATTVGAATDYGCGELAIRDPEGSRWTLATFAAGAREGFDRVTIELTRSGNAPRATVVRAEWTTPREAAARFDIARPTGGRALVLTLDGQVELGANQAIDASQLDAEGVGTLRSVQVFVTEADGLTRAVIGIRGDGCARLESRQWAKKGRDRQTAIWVDVQAS